MNSDSILKVWGPLVITLVILSIFGWAFYLNPNDPGLIEVVKNVFILAVGFWIGSSGGSKRREGEAALTLKPPATVSVRKTSKAEARRREIGDRQAPLDLEPGR